MNNIKILIAIHKEFPIPHNEAFLPIQVGKKLAKQKLDILGDDQGDNISKKNSTYGELTALYWAWKNLKNIDYIGLNHYRRYFCFKRKYQHSIFLSQDKFTKHIDLINGPKIIDVLSTYDIIKVKPFTYSQSVESVLIALLSYEDLRILDNLIKEKYPKYYKTYINYMRYNNKISSCNMFISKVSIFNEYSSWLFELLFELEKRVRISPYEIPMRIFGFLSEALFNVYCINNNLKIKYYSIYVIREDVNKESNLIYTLKNIRRNISFYFNRPSQKYKYE